MDFYRVQLENGAGVYRSSFYGEVPGLNIATEYEMMSKHPTPINDSKLMENCLSKDLADTTNWGEPWPNKNFKNYIFGFSSIEQFHSWFYNDEFKGRLAKVGYKLFVIRNAQHVVKGNTQAIISRRYFNWRKKEKLELTSV